MSARLILWACQPDAAWLDPADTPLALGALAVRLADPALPPEVIDAALAQRYDLTRSEAEEMRMTCEEVAAALPPVAEYCRLIEAHVCPLERTAFAHCLREAGTQTGLTDGLWEAGVFALDDASGMRRGTA